MSDSAQEQAIAMRRAGQSLRQIAKVLGVSATMVHRWTSVSASPKGGVSAPGAGVSANTSGVSANSTGGGNEPLAGGVSAVSANTSDVSANAPNVGSNSLAGGVSAPQQVSAHTRAFPTVHDPVARVLERLSGIRQTKADQWEARCPAHEDRHASLGVSRGEDNQALLYCHAGCSLEEIVAAAGLQPKDLFVNESLSRYIEATYDYRNLAGELLYQVVRFKPKKFMHRRPDGQGDWIWNVQGVPRVLYCWQELAAADPAELVFIPEGEKDVESLRSLGFVATCNSGGAKKWKQLSDDSVLNGRRVVIIPDVGQAGIDHATDVARRLFGRAAEVRIVPTPEGSKDVSKWIEDRDALGRAEFREALLLAVEAAGAVTPESLQQAALRVVAAEADDGQEESPEDALAPVELGSRDPKTGRIVLSPRRTLPTALAFVNEHYAHPEGRTLQNYSGMLLAWKDNRYAEIEDESLSQLLQPWLHHALRYVMSRRTGEPELADFESNPGTVKSALDSVRTLVHLPGRQSPPMWLGDAAGLLPASELLPCRSMLLHLPTLRQLTPTPKLFVTNALEFDYAPDAPEPTAWLEFLEQVLPGDPASIYLLQSWFGYALTADTSHQKMMLLVGPRRSGKGTVGRVLTRLIGQGNICGPTTSSLAGPFGLQPLIGKLLAIVSDARFSSDNIAAVVERLLCISGEDTLTIDRKFLGSVTLKLPTRFMFLTNELPKLSESSGALAGRFLVVRFDQTFFGREDLLLTEKLSTELPGILKWAVDGWHNLRRDGRFVEPEASRTACEELEDLLSPVGAFVRERCRVAPTSRIGVKDLYGAWCEWCSENGRDYHGTVQNFSRDLQAAVPKVRTRRNHGFGRFMEGIQLVEHGSTA